MPPWVPGYQMSRIAGTFSAAQRRSSEAAVHHQQHDRCAGGRHGLEQGQAARPAAPDWTATASPIMFCHSPRTSTAASTSRARVTARSSSAASSKPAGSTGRCRPTCRTSRGRCAGRDGCPARTRPRRPDRPAPGCPAAPSPSRPGRSRRPRARWCRAASRPVGRSPRSSLGSSRGSRSPSLRNSTADRCAAVAPRGGLGLRGRRARTSSTKGWSRRPHPDLRGQDTADRGVERGHQPDRPRPPPAGVRRRGR